MMIQGIEPCYPAPQAGALTNRRYHHLVNLISIQIQNIFFNLNHVNINELKIHFYVIQKNYVNNS